MLHDEGVLLSDKGKERLVELCLLCHPKKKIALGFDGLATNVIFYRAAPNTTPLVLRGSLGQKPYVGLVPRFDELSMGGSTA